MWKHFGCEKLRRSLWLVPCFHPYLVLFIELTLYELLEIFSWLLDSFEFLGCVAVHDSVSDFSSEWKGDLARYVSENGRYHVSWNICVVSFVATFASPKPWLILDNFFAADRAAQVNHFFVNVNVFDVALQLEKLRLGCKNLYAIKLLYQNVVLAWCTLLFCRSFLLLHWNIFIPRGKLIVPFLICWLKEYLTTWIETFALIIAYSRPFESNNLTLLICLSGILAPQSNLYLSGLI